MHRNALGLWRVGRILAGAILAGLACTPDISTKRNAPERGTLGQELYGVLCDRVGAQSLREDLTGASFHPLCHPVNGAWADKVDARFLPNASSEAQQQARAHAIARLEAFARRRSDLIAALDATFPEMRVPAKNLKDADPNRTCNPSGDERLADQLRDLLERLHAQNLYADGTLPQSTQSLGRLFTAFNADADFQSAMARLDARQGYRPPDVTLGAARPLLAYPRLRELNNSVLSLISPDSNPYDPNTRTDSQGHRIPVAGPLNPQFSKLIEVAHEELRTAEPDLPNPDIPLAVARDPNNSRDVLNRPRTTAEALQEVLLVQDPLLGGGDPRYIVRRDKRGAAAVTLVNGVVPPPFVDANPRDGLADIDELGRFVTDNGRAAPTPFPTVDEQTGVSRDRYGRATTPDGRLYYQYVDTSHTLVAALLDDLKPLVNPDPSQNHETLMDAIAGLQPLLGSRQAASKTYAADPARGATPITVSYSRYNPDTSPLLDLAHAANQTLGDPTIDDTLQLVRKLFAEHPNDLARVVGAMLKAKDIANRHSEATLSSTSIFWDELIAVAVELVREPGLLEDLLRALGNDDAVPFKDVVSMQMSHKDLISYDRRNLNAAPLSYLPGSPTREWEVDLASGQMFTTWYTPVDRTRPDTGNNRSFFQRYLQLIHDTNGVTACNAENGRLFLRDLCAPTVECFDFLFPPARPALECEIFKIKNLAKFYLDAIVGQAAIHFRSTLGFGAFQSPQVFAASSGMTEFWPTVQGVDTRPKPQFLNRLVFFDLTDSPNPGDRNYLTNCFISALHGPFVDPPQADANLHCNQPPPVLPPGPDFNGGIGSIVCPARTITDPYRLPNSCGDHPCCPGAQCPTDAEGPDYQIAGLGHCSDGDWLYQRDNNVLFAFEQPLTFPDGTTGSAYRALTPVVSAFVNRGKEELFLSLIEVLHRHWQDEHGSPSECDPSGTPATNPRYCSQDGLVRSEAMLAEIFGETDLLPSLNNLNKIVSNITIQHCAAVDPSTHQCTSFVARNGISVMAEAARALLDPARNVGLIDRRGNRTTTWNDGTTVVPQVTPLYLLTDAIKGIDRAFSSAADRQTTWERARSQLVDQFLGVNGSGPGASFSRPGLPRVMIAAIDVLRAQLLAKCPSSFTPPFARCGWARDEILSNLTDTVQGPLFATTEDLTEAIRQNVTARTETEKLLQYLFGSGSQDNARPALLASLADVVQLLSDQINFIPILHALGPAVSNSDPRNPDQKALLDAQLALLTRASGRAFNPNNVELCSKEVDPNQVITRALALAATPMNVPGKPVQTPLEVIMDVVADVNRAAPERTDKLKPEDYRSIFDQVADFLLSQDHGLEQFYEIVRQGTVSR